MYIYIYINYIYNIYINKRINMHIYNIYITTIYIHINVYVYIWYMFIYVCVSFTISPRLHFNLKGIIQILFWLPLQNSQDKPAPGGIHCHLNSLFLANHLK